MSLFQPERLYGRSAEESMLLNSYFASLSMGKNDHATVILIHGDSGVGKTQLAETLRSNVEEDDGYFIKGKFDQLSYGSADRPYQGIRSAFAEYSSALEHRDKDTWHEVTKKLRRGMKGDECRLLSEAIPSLRKILGRECIHEESVAVQRRHSRRHSCDACQHVDLTQEGIPEEKKEEQVDIFSEISSHRLNHLITKFSTIISSVDDPIVLLVDDIQWANKTDLDALKALYLGAKSSFLFIFTCRPMDINHPFLTLANDFQNKTEIQLNSLREESVLELVSSLLSIRPSECRSLSKFITGAANGNPFFVRQQLISLEKEGYLVRNENNEWVWNIDVIEEMHAGSSSDAVSLLSERMKKLPALTQKALRICACIGKIIDLYILGLLLQEVQSETNEDNEALAKKAISTAIKEGLLAIGQDGGVTFTHDLCKEAAYSLIEPERREYFHFKLGKVLSEMICPNLQQKYMYTIASQLARGNELITGDDDRISMAHVFKICGEKSMSAFAFAEAHYYFTKSIHLLREQDWRTQYRLCCDIYMLAADTAANQEDMNKFLSVLFLHCSSSKPETQVDFLDASYIEVRFMSTKNDPKSLQTCLEALRGVGERFPSRNMSFHTMRGLTKIRCSMARTNLNKLLEMEPIHDKKILSILRLLQIGVTLSLSWGQDLLPLLCFRIIQINLSYGISNGLATAVALYGGVLCRFGFFLSEAEKYANYALAIQDKLQCEESLSNVAFLTTHVFTMTKKLDVCIRPFRKGFDAGIKHGDIIHAGSCAASVCNLSFHTGIPLTKCSRTLNAFRSTMLDFNMVRALQGNQVYRKVVDYCQGVPGASRIVFFDEEDDGLKTNVLMYEQSKLLELVVACIFCEHDLAWHINLSFSEYEKAYAGSIFPYICTFYRGMSAIGEFRISRSKQASSMLKACMKMLKRGRIICLRGKEFDCILTHQLYLLEAEWRACNNKYVSAEQFYLLAIKHAERVGTIHENAFACEKFAYHLLERNNYEQAHHYIKEAYWLYWKWGSPRKCEQLKRNYIQILEDKKQFVNARSVGRLCVK